MEKKSADVNQGIFSKRNLIPRLFLRTLYVIVCGFFAAMLPFFGDINGVVGAIGFIPLDFVLPMLLYNMTYKPTKSSAAYWINNSIIVVFTCVGIMGAFSSIRKLVQDAAEFKLFSSDVVDWLHMAYGSFSVYNCTLFVLTWWSNLKNFSVNWRFHPWLMI